MGTRFSIVTISYNASDCITRTIESVLSQDFYNYEYIFMDGKSLNNTNEIIESYKVKFKEKGIRVVHVSEKDRGISDAFNKGIAASTGEIIVILNAGDEMLPVTLLKLDKAFDGDVQIIFGNVIWKDIITGNEHVRKSDPRLKKLLYDMHIMHPATYVKKTAYDKFGDFDINFKYCMDKDLLYRFYVNGVKFKYIDDEFTRFWSGGTSDGLKMDSLMEEERMTLKYNEPFVKVRLVTIRKIAVYHAAHFIRKLKKEM